MFGKLYCTCYFSCGFLLIFLVDLCVPSTAQNDTKFGDAPLEFPKNESQYPFRHNETSLETLIAHTSNITNDTNTQLTASEVDDLRHGGEFANISHPLVPEIPPEPELETTSSLSINRKFDTELIENNDTNTEDKGVNNSVPVKSVRLRDSHASKMPVVQGQLAAILAGVLVIIAVLGYAALLSWRRFLEGRYGNREMLINEEDFYDPNDMRHFSL